MEKLKKHEINTPVDFYTEADFKSSSIFAKMTLIPDW